MPLVIANEEDRLLLMSAFRYALGRMTYIVETIARHIEACWPDLLTNDRELIHREIRAAIDSGRAGMECDIAVWRRILALPL